LIERDKESKSYFLGREIYALGTLAAPRYGIHQLALPALHRLAALSQDSAFLCLLTGNEVMCVHREEGTYPIRTHVIQAGSRYPLGVGSFGPAILAAMDESTAEEFIVATSREIAARYKEFSVDKLRQFVKTARRTEFSVNPGLVYPGSWGIAVAVIDARGQPIGALSIGAVESRLQPERQPKLAAALKAESLALTKQLTKQRSR
jgi:DNA-binding IclR family transcriptional regulator